MKAKFTATVNPRIKTLAEFVKLDVRDMREMLVFVDSQFASDEKKLFSTEGASGGEKWPPLKRKRSPKKYAKKKIMQRTGRLRKGLVNLKDKDHVATYSLRPRPTLSVGTKNIVAAYHIPGVLKNPRVPVRDTLQQSGVQAQKMFGNVADYLLGKKKRIERTLAAWKDFKVGRGRA